MWLLENSRSPDTVNDIPYLDDTKINNLLFADDLAIFSLSKEDLQKRIAILQQYSNEWMGIRVKSKQNKDNDFQQTRSNSNYKEI